jgi:hypothetical protein
MELAVAPARVPHIAAGIDKYLAHRADPGRLVLSLLTAHDFDHLPSKFVLRLSGKEAAYEFVYRNVRYAIIEYVVRGLLNKRAV